MFSVGGKNGNSGRESRKRFQINEEDPPTLLEGKCFRRNTEFIYP